MLPFQRTFISSYPKATQDTQPNAQQLVSNSREIGLMEKWSCIWEISDNPKIIALFSPTIAY